MVELGSESEMFFFTILLFWDVRIFLVARDLHNICFVSLQAPYGVQDTYPLKTSCKNNKFLSGVA